MLFASLICFFEAVAHEQEDTITIGRDRFALTAHTSNFTGNKDGFASLAYHLNGSIVESPPGSALSWLYTSSIDSSGKWTSHVRSFHLDAFNGDIGPRVSVLNGTLSDRWATIHLVLRAAHNTWLCFYSTGKGVKAAISTSPEGPFIPDELFYLRPSSTSEINAWENGCSLEADGGFSLVADNATSMTGWIMYDTLCPNSTGLIGWAKVCLNKVNRSVRLLGRDVANPRNFSLPGRVAARTGGNLASDVTFGGLPAIFYLSKPSSAQCEWAVVLGGNESDRRILQPDLHSNRELTAGLLGQRS